MVKGNKISERKRGKKTLTDEQLNEKYVSYTDNVNEQNGLIVEANIILPSDKQVKLITVMGIEAWKKYKPTGETKEQKVNRIVEKKAKKQNNQDIKNHAKEQKKIDKISMLQEKIDKLRN